MGAILTLKGIIGVLIVFSLLITFHELGHLIVALLLKMPVQEFSLGFGKAIYQRKIGDVLFSIRIFPLGGYVKLLGESPEEADDPNSFYNQPYWKRFLVILAGPLANYLFAFLIIAITMSFLTLEPGIRVYNVYENSPAAKAGIKPGDVILSVNGKKISSGKELIKLVSDKAGKPVTLEIKRGNQVKVIQAIPKYNEDLKRAILGVQLDLAITRGEFNPIRGIRFAWEYVKEVTYRYTVFLLHIRSNYSELKGSLRGPIGIGQLIYKFTLERSIYEIAIFTAFLNIAIGYINLLPFPALDGGRALFLIIAFLWEKGLRKKWDPSKEEVLHFIGFSLLLILIAIVTFMDISRILSNR